ncbi:MAG: glycosyltransferase family 39 protein, partial [Isosphaeraceae bacterium]|nr:glycosyltransferase family 39 protein [Isosphaeraceae bacterium]
MLLLVSALIRLHHVDAPIADNLASKQVHTANKARTIAGPPWYPLRNTLSFLNANGQRMELTEEVPIYSALLGLGYRLLSERHWIGHILSLLGTLIALAAYYDLMRRERGACFALIASMLLAFSPLLIFYGRAVMPDSWMLACMLLCGTLYQRYLDDGRLRWLM